MSGEPLRLGTRKSPMAMTQSSHVARMITECTGRAVELTLLRPDIRSVPIRGNAGTRLGKVGSGELDAVVLAAAGLARIGLMDAVTQLFDPEDMVPAPGQGALAVECLDDAPELAALLSSIDDSRSRAAVTAERSLLAALEAGCSAPVGAYAAGTAIHLHLQAVVVGSTDGQPALRAARSGPASDAEQLGHQLAAELISRGAGTLISVPLARSSDGEDAQ